MYHIKKKYLGKVKLVRGTEQLVLNEQATQEQLESWFSTDPTARQYIYYRKKRDNG